MLVAMEKTYLDKAYDALDVNETRDLYDEWALSYEAELGENGYATPGRCAAALAQFSKDQSAPMLDFGCGTGLSGLAFGLAGFTTIDGADLSMDMLDGARAKNIYRALHVVDATASLKHQPGDYAAIAAVGVFGAAPLSLFDVLMKGLGTGGLFVFSFNDHSLEDPAFEARVNEWVDCGAARLLFREHGPHIPGIELKSNVYVIEKN